MTPLFSIRLAKQDFKFSVAHFTIFGPAMKLGVPEETGT